MRHVRPLGLRSSEALTSSFIGSFGITDYSSTSPSSSPSTSPSTSTRGRMKLAFNNALVQLLRTSTAVSNFQHDGSNTLRHFQLRIHDGKIWRRQFLVVIRSAESGAFQLILVENGVPFEAIDSENFVSLVIGNGLKCSLLFTNRLLRLNFTKKCHRQEFATFIDEFFPQIAWEADGILRHQPGRSNSNRAVTFVLHRSCLAIVDAVKRKFIYFISLRQLTMVACVDQTLWLTTAEIGILQRGFDDFHAIELTGNEKVHPLISGVKHQGDFQFKLIRMRTIIDPDYEKKHRVQAKEVKVGPTTFRFVERVETRTPTADEKQKRKKPPTMAPPPPPRFDAPHHFYSL